MDGATYDELENLEGDAVKKSLFVNMSDSVDGFSDTYPEHPGVYLQLGNAIEWVTLEDTIKLRDSLTEVIEEATKLTPGWYVLEGSHARHTLGCRFDGENWLDRMGLPNYTMETDIRTGEVTVVKRIGDL